MLKRIFLVYNPQSSRHAEIEQGVLAPVRSLRGWMVGKYAVKPTSFAENVQNLLKLVNDGDLVIVAGGDGTATMAINGILTSGKDVVVAVLGYGNFDDIAAMLGARHQDAAKGAECIQEIIQKFQNHEITELYPLEIKINGKHWRYAPAYMSAGLLAQATTLLEEQKIREQSNTGKRKAVYFWWQAVKWYLKHRRHNFLPAGEINGQALSAKATDYIAVNSPSLAKIIKGGDWWRDSENFGSTVQNLGKFWAMSRFGLKSISKGLPLQETRQDVIELAKPSTVEIHVEGEYEKLENVEQIEVKKSSNRLKIILLEGN